MFRARSCFLRPLSSHGWLHVIVLVISLTGLLPRPYGHAQSSSQAAPNSSESAAKALFREGVEHSRAGRGAEAVLAFERSRALFERPSVLQNLAFALERVGRYADALEVIARFVVITHGDSRAPGSAQLSTLREQLDQRVLHLDLTVEPHDAALEIDSVTRQPTQPSAGSYALTLDPGKHELRASRQGYGERVWPLVAAPGAKLTDRVILSPVLALAPAPAIPEPVEPAPRVDTKHASLWSRPAKWAVALGSTALALTVAGAITYRLAGKRIDGCPEEGCSRAESKGIERLDYTARGLFIAAGTFALGSGLLWYRAYRTQSRAAIALGVHPSGHAILNVRF